MMTNPSLSMSKRKQAESLPESQDGTAPRPCHGHLESGPSGIHGDSPLDLEDHPNSGYQAKRG